MSQTESADRQRRARELTEALGAPEKAQQDLLTTILRENAQTQFGRSHGFSTVRDLEGYRRAVPPAGFDSFQPQIEAMLAGAPDVLVPGRSEEHTSELQSQSNLVCRLLLEKKKRRQVTYR